MKITPNLSISTSWEGFQVFILSYSYLVPICFVSVLWVIFRTKVVILPVCSGRGEEVNRLVCVLLVNALPNSYIHKISIVSDPLLHNTRLLESTLPEDVDGGRYGHRYVCV